MNKKAPYIVITLFVITLIFSCSKEKTVIPEDEPTIENNYQFTIGEKDSSTYYLYQPSLDLNYINNGAGAYAVSDSFDLNFDGTNDIALQIDGFDDNFSSGTPTFAQLTFFNLANYDIVCDTVNDNIDDLSLGDTLKSSMNWINRDSFLLNYSSSIYQEGNWFSNPKYIGYRTITSTDTIMGWISLLIYPQMGVALRINDSAIEIP